MAKFQKVAATPANAVLVDRTDSGKSAASRKAANGDSGDEVVDKTPITDDEGKEDGENDDFGGFDEEEDQDIIEKGKRNAMRRRGLDPNVLNKNKKDDKPEADAAAAAAKADKTKSEKSKKDKKAKAGKAKKEEDSEAEKPKAKGKAKSKKEKATK